MHKIGLVGGMSWHSTKEYYRVVNERVAEAVGGHASAPLVLESLDFAVVRRCQETGRWDEAAELLADAARHCAASGAETIAIATNLMHKVAPQVAAAVDVPLLHIADAVGEHAARQGWRRLGVLGTRWVMEEDFYAERLAAHGVQAVAPGAEDRCLVDRIVFDELTRGIVREESRASYAAVVSRLAEAGADAVVLACTEIGLLLDQASCPLPMVDSMQVHAEALAARVLA